MTLRRPPTSKHGTKKQKHICDRVTLTTGILDNVLVTDLVPFLVDPDSGKQHGVTSLVIPSQLGSRVRPECICAVGVCPSAIQWQSQPSTTTAPYSILMNPTRHRCRLEEKSTSKMDAVPACISEVDSYPRTSTRQPYPPQEPENSGCPHLLKAQRDVYIEKYLKKLSPREAES
jgi:hypothetical protein